MGKDLRGKKLGKGIVQRKDGTYCARAMVNGETICLYGSNYQQLKKDLEAAKEKAKSGIFNKPDYTVSEWFHIWFDTYKVPMIKESSIAPMKRKVAGTFLPYVGDMMLDEVRSIDLQIAIKELLEEGRIAKSSISEALNRLSDCFASAVNNRYMLTNPAHDLVVPFKEEPWKERRWLNVDEIKIFLDETKESYPFWFPLHYIMIYTGMRIGEVGGLKWGDVHLEGGYIELKQALSVEYKQGKKLISLTTLKTTNFYRKIPFMGQVKEMFLQQKEQVELLKRELKDRYRGKGEFEDLVFVTTLGSPLIRHNAEKTINKVVDSINTKEAYEARREQREPVLFERVYPHALRHTFASICYAAKMDVKTTQKLMGHAKISTTMDIYTHLDEMFLEDDITKFNEYILKGK
ncbi:site-specific integrase [Candidatus Ventrimonas sp. KK005]